MSKSERYYQEYLSHRHVSRRGLFRAFVSAARQVAPETPSAYPVIPLPPGALPVAEFNAQCTQCHLCIDACPMGILDKHESGLPQLNIQYASCDGCGLCIEACDIGALLPQTRFDTGLRPVFNASCINPVRRCNQCVDSCTAQACTIGENWLPELDSERCTGCGECLVQCNYDAVTLVPSAF
jgi:ferredoxin-type protein NapF